MQSSTAQHAEALEDWARLVGIDCEPYPWQHRLYATFAAGTVPRSLYLPTGTGKTSAALLYLLALLAGAPLPRRLVYIVDRRAIVDQTHATIDRWTSAVREIPRLSDAVSRMAGLPANPGSAPIPVGVLRGGVADGGEWRVDPARPAVVVGTVDMIGSRLLFSGYGDGRTRRPLHAGPLGHDATVMLDEAHLSAPMHAFVVDAGAIAARGGGANRRAGAGARLARHGHERYTRLELTRFCGHPEKVFRRCHHGEVETVCAGVPAADGGAASHRPHGARQEPADNSCPVTRTRACAGASASVATNVRAPAHGRLGRRVLVAGPHPAPPRQ